MKKILARFLVLMLCAMLGVGVFATDTTTVPPPDSTVEITVTDGSTFDALIEGLTNSTFWTTSGMVLIAVVGCIATFRKNFGFITDLISKKADEKTISEALKKSASELTEMFNAKLAEIDNNEKILTAMLTIFMTNANINPNAKAEILNYLTGIKELNGKVADIVDAANKIIEEANVAEVKALTPALDSIVSEDTEGNTDTPMVLG